MDQYFDYLSQQISELDLLQSMYPRPGEITILNENNLVDIKKVINGESEFLPNHLEYVLNLDVNNLKLEICFNLPTNYPEEEPDIYVRCNNLNRHQETNLNLKLSEYITEIQNKEVCLYSAISWIQDNIESFAGTPSNVLTNKSDSVPCITKLEQFTRYWIYSHHIYNKKKREEISKKAKELKLTGFCLPGKPGIVCIEGDESSCKEWWQDIKSMNWKKIVLRKVECFDINEQSNHRKFNTFEEIHFQSANSNKHSNMSEFSKFMSKCELNDIFNELFGFNE